MVDQKIINKIKTDLEKIYDPRKNLSSAVLGKGMTLNNLINKIMGDKNLNLWLLNFLPKESGIMLGKTSYYNDIDVGVFYGLTIDFDTTPRVTKLFTGESVHRSELKSVIISSSFPDYSTKYNFSGWPSPEEFLEKFNNVFSSKDISGYLKDLNQEI